MTDQNITIKRLREMKQAGDKIACLTCYDASFTRLVEAAGTEVILVGDSLGTVIQGHDSTLPVTLDQMIYHTANVARVRKHALLVADMPFMSYRSTTQALESAARLMQEGGAQMVKLEGGKSQLATTNALAEQGIPVCGHLGLLPQSVHKLSGYRVQGRDPESARRIIEDAMALEHAGADLLVLECVPGPLGKSLSEEVSIPVIGIGAGVDTDGQVLVLYDMLGMNPSPAKFVHDFMADASDLQQALSAFVQAVRQGRFPAEQHGYQ